MPDVRFILQALSGEFHTFVDEIQKPIAKAATAAIKNASAEVKKESRAAFAGAGFSGKSQKAMKSVITPKTGDSINPSVDFFLRPAYLNVFEQGAVITGKPLLWIPLETVPFGEGGKRLTPGQYIERIGPLYSAKNARQPMLVGKGTRAGILRATSKVVRLRKRAVASGTIKGSVNVPLFIGVPAVNLKKRFDLAGIVERVSHRIGEFYLKNFKAE